MSSTCTIQLYKPTFLHGADTALFPPWSAQGHLGQERRGGYLAFLAASVSRSIGLDWLDAR